MEKMWPYETDVRIPFYIAGPGIEAGQTPSVMGINVDIAPTLLALAGLPKPNTMDGHSLLPLIMGDASSKSAAAKSWRTRAIIAFAEGATQTWSAKFPALGTPASSVGLNVSTCDHGAPAPPIMYELGGCITGLASTSSHTAKCATSDPTVCKNFTFDNPENQWRMLRVANATDDIAYMQWDPLFVFDPVAFHAFFDVETDPNQQRNLWPSLPPAKQAALEAEMEELFSCHGTAGAPSNCP